MAKTEKELVKIIRHHDRLYYVKAEPEISDAEYDAIVREYRKLDPEFERFQPGLQVHTGPALKDRDAKDTEREAVSPHEFYTMKDQPGRTLVVTHRSKWTVWYWDGYDIALEKQAFRRATSRIGWDFDVERGELTRIKGR